MGCPMARSTTVHGTCGRFDKLKKEAYTSNIEPMNEGQVFKRVNDLLMK